MMATAGDVEDRVDAPLYRRYSLDAAGRAVRANPSNAIWSAQIQNSSAFLCAEQYHNFAFYTAPHNLYRQLGLHVGDLVQRRARAAQNRAGAAQDQAAVRPKVAEDPDGDEVSAPQAAAVPAPESLRAFLKTTPANDSAVDLRAGIRISPDDGGLHGYAWDRNQPKQPLHIVAFAGQKPIFSEMANGPNLRWEDGQLVTSPKRNGFHLALPKDLKSGYFVDCYVAEYKVRIEGFPLVVKRGRLVPPSKLQTALRRLRPWRG